MPPAGGARLTAGLRRGEKGPAAATTVSAGARSRAHGRSREDRDRLAAVNAERCSLLPTPVAAGFILLNSPPQSRDLIVCLTKNYV